MRWTAGEAMGFEVDMCSTVKMWWRFGADMSLMEMVLERFEVGMNWECLSLRLGWLGGWTPRH